jgi:hypothetical protein
VPERTLNSASLAELLERVPVERAGGKTTQETTQAQAQHVLMRIAALTDVVRGAAANESTRLASRLLLDDLATVAALFRARANDLGTSLTGTLDDLKTSLARGDSLRDPAPEPPKP